MAKTMSDYSGNMCAFSHTEKNYDGAEPSGNSIAARNLILLSQYFGEDSYRQRDYKLFKFYLDQQRFGYSFPEMLSAFMLYEKGVDLVAVVGPNSAATEHMIDICRKYYTRGMIIVHVNPFEPYKAYNHRVQDKFKMVNGQTAVYICHNKMCHMPVTDPIKLEDYLKKKFCRDCQY